MSTKFFSHPILENKMSSFDIENLKPVINSKELHGHEAYKPYVYRHKTSDSVMFKCGCCDFECAFYKDKELKKDIIQIKQTELMRKHMLSYDHRFNEYYAKGLVPVIPEFDGDLINNTFDFFKEHITTIPDDDGVFWCDLCDVSFKTKKQLYTHLVKSNKKHLVRQVEKENDLPYKVIVSDNMYSVEYKNKKITPDVLAKMEKYKNEDGEYSCKYCSHFKPVDTEDFYNHLTSKGHKRNKLLEEKQQTYSYKGINARGIKDYDCNKCGCCVSEIELLKHDESH